MAEITKDCIQAMNRGRLLLTARPILELISSELMNNRMSLKLSDNVSRQSFFLTENATKTFKEDNATPGDMVQILKWTKANIPIIEMLKIIPIQKNNINYNDFTPIHILNNYVKNPLLCLRVLKKDAVRTWSKASGDGQLFSMT